MHSLHAWCVLLCITHAKILAPTSELKQFFSKGSRLGYGPAETSLADLSPVKETPVKTEDGHADPCNDETNPCLCVDDGCGWDSDLNKCVNGSTTTCHECNTIRDDCVPGVCQDFGCPSTYNRSLICQCTEQCIRFGNCCKDVTTSSICLSRTSQNIVKIAEDNALWVGIVALAVLVVAGVSFAICYTKKESEKEDESFIQRPRFQTLRSARSNQHYTRLTTAPEAFDRWRSSGNMSDYAKVTLVEESSDRTPLIMKSDSTHEQLYNSTRRQTGSIDNYHGRNLRFNSTVDSFSHKAISPTSPSSIFNAASCDLQADRFEPNSWEKIGSGNYGDVFSAKWFGRVVAVKKGRGSNEKSRDDMLTEAAQLRDLSHPSLCEFHGVVLLKREVWIVTKFYRKGSLDKLLKRETVSLERKFKWCRQACGGLAFLHDKNLVHRDLACRNLLISKDDDCVIADFGLSRLLNNSGDRRKTTSKIGPVRWMALESLTQIYSTASDMWMFGVLVWEMLNDAKQPYSDVTNNEVVLKVHHGLRLPLDDAWPPELNAMLSKCWKKDPAQRPTATELLTLFEELTGYAASPRARKSM